MQFIQQEKERVKVEKIWLKSYEHGVPAEINPDAYQSLVDVFEIACKRFYARPALYNFGVTLTYQALDQYSRDFAAYLQNQLKLKKGDRIAIMLPNILQYPIAMFAALRAGLIVVNVNPLYTADELLYQLKDSGAETIIALSNFANTVEKVLPSLPSLKNIIITDIGDLLPPMKSWLMYFVLKYIRRSLPNAHIPSIISFKKALHAGKDLPLSKISFSNEDTAFLQYTGGTTGVSKGAILSHRNIIANLQQADVWFKSIISEGQEIIITALPLYHIFSLTGNCLFFSKIGGLNVLITNPRDISGTIREMKKFKFTAITGVNTLFNALLKHPNFKKLDFSELKLTLGGGMAVQEVVAEQWQKITGKPIIEAYGLTETSPCVTINPVNAKKYSGMIGLPVSSTDVCVLDEEGHEVPLGECGELAVKGPQVMKAYWNNLAETEKVFTPSGWFLTGDIVSMNKEGYLRIIERKKDMILVSGFNVYPNEIEDVIAKLPGVREVAVVGVLNENSGEAVKAFIVKEDENLTKDQVIRYCREHLTPYKVPKDIEFREELPKSNVGKILRRFLKNNVNG